MRATMIPEELMEKARAHEVTYRAMGRADSDGDDDLRDSIGVARWALREDIQRLAAQVAVTPSFWREVFGDYRSECPSAIEGMCNAYDEECGMECGYLCLIDECTQVCLKTKAAVAAMPPGYYDDPGETEPSATADKGGNRHGILQ